MTSAEVFEKHVNPYIEARLRSVPEQQRASMVESIYRDAAEAFGVSLEDIMDSRTRGGNAITQSLFNAPMSIAFEGGAGQGMSGQGIMAALKALFGYVEKNDKQDILQTGLEGRKVSPRLAKVLGSSGLGGLHPTLVPVGDTYQPLLDEKGRPVMRPAVAEDGTILNGAAFDGMLRQYAGKHQLLDTDLGELAGYMPQQLLNDMYLAGRSDSTSKAYLPSELITGGAEEGTLRVAPTATEYPQTEDERTRYSEAAKALDWAGAPPFAWFVGRGVVGGLRGAMNVFKKGLINKTPTWVKTGDKLAGKALIALGPIGQASDAVKGIARVNKSVDDFNKGGDITDYHEAISKDDDSLYAKYRLGGTKDVLDSSGSLPAAFGKAMFNTALGAVSGVDKAVLRPVYQPIFDKKNLAFINDFRNGDIGGGLLNAGSTAARLGFAAIAGDWTRRNLTRTTASGKKAPGSLLTTNAYAGGTTAFTHEMAGPVLNTYMQKAKAIRDMQDGWRNVEARQRVSTSPNTMLTIGDLQKRVEENRQSNIPAHQRGALAMYGNRPDTPLAQAYSDWQIAASMDPQRRQNMLSRSIPRQTQDEGEAADTAPVKQRTTRRDNE